MSEDKGSKDDRVEKLEKEVADLRKELSELRELVSWMSRTVRRHTARY